MSIIGAAIRLSTPLTFAALGGLYSERSGIFNIALEGILLFGAFGGALATYYTGSPFAGLMGALLCGLAASLIHAVVTILFHADQIISGVGVNILAIGLPTLLTSALFGTPSSSPPVENWFKSFDVPLLEHIPLINELFSGHSLPVYCSFFAVYVTYIVFRKTRFGLRITAAGENPAALDVTGVSVIKYRFFGVMLSGLLGGLGGAYLSISHGTQFIKNMSAGRGYIALAALILGKWKPVPTFFACLLFGFADALQIRLQGRLGIPVEFIQMIPYILTILILAGFIGKSIPPRASGKHYYRSG